jgi:two-component system, LytTR family, response regulator
MMKAVIIDDERLARVELRRMLAAHPEVQIAGEARGGEEAIRLIGTLSPDLIFLDIEMPGMSGFELLEHLDDVPRVIFTTGYDQYAIRAFEVSALDYLMKPIAPERLEAALARVRPAQPAKSRLEQVFVRDGERCWIVRLADVFLMESEGNYTRLCFGKDRPLIRRSLNALEQDLDPAVFFRANRKQIVNLKWVRETAVGIGGALVMTLRGGTEVEISRRAAARLREVMSW